MAFEDGWVWVMGLEIGDGAELGEFGDEWVRRWSLASICGFGFGRDRWIWVLGMEIEEMEFGRGDGERRRWVSGFFFSWNGKEEKLRGCSLRFKEKKIELEFN